MRRSELDSNIKRPTDWTCPLCYANVFASRDKCYRCYTKRPEKKEKKKKYISTTTTTSIFGSAKKIWTIITVSYAAYRLIRYLLPIIRRRNMIRHALSFLRQPPSFFMLAEHFFVLICIGKHISLKFRQSTIQISRNIVLPNPMNIVGRGLRNMRRRKNNKPRRPKGFKAFTWRGKTDLNFVEAWGPEKLLSYSKAKSYLYGFVDNENDKVTGIYTGETRVVERAKNLEDRKRLTAASTLVYDAGHGINCEHVWPQSLLKRANCRDAISDMHHLFPAQVEANRLRGHLPFGDVDDRVARLIGKDDDEEMKNNHDKSSEIQNGSWFEPREVSKGNVARAIFYVRTIYSGQLEKSKENMEFFEKMAKTLRKWHWDDLPDEREIRRTHEIERIQGNCNPFILKPKWVDEIYFSEG